MLKVLIADDEIRICELIKNLIDWKSIDFEIIYQASNGQDAYENIIKYEPNLVITDIRMPVLDGIGLIERAANVLPATRFIVISGYQDFDYAQRAIRLGVSDYILKPIDEGELLSSILKIKDEILNLSHKANSEKPFAINNSSSIEHFTIEFLDNILKKPTEPFPCIDLINKNYNLSLIDEFNKVVLYKLDSPLNIVESGLESLIIQKMLDVLERCFKNIPGFCCYSSSKLIVSIVNLQLSPLFVSDAILSAFSEMREYSSSLGDFHVTVGVGSTTEALSTIHKSYDSALMAIKCRMMLGIDKIIAGESLNFRPHSLRDLFPIQVQNKLRSAFAIFHIQDSIRLIEEILAPFKTNQLSAGTMLDLVDRILDMLFDILQDNDLLHLAMNPKSTMLALLNDCTTAISYIDMLIDFVEQTLTRCYDAMSKQIYSPVEKAKSYVAINFGRPLSLDDVAAQVHLNPTYFSELFKRITGENFWDYLINHRMLMAQEYLKSPEKKVHEISNLVGYTDSRHFSKIFKKIVGITPKEYRDLYT